MKIKEVEESDPIALIKRDCQPFLQQADNPLMLYRGIEFRDNYGFIRKKVRKENRYAKGMGERRKVIVNEYFKEKFGKPYRNSVFCVPNANIASDFGNVHNIFPIGEFSYLWSTVVEDLNFAFAEALGVQPSWQQDLRNPLISDEDFLKRVDDIYDALDKYRYKETGLNDAAKVRDNEIMIWCDYYYAIPKDHIHQSIPNPYLKQDFIKQLKS